MLNSPVLDTAIGLVFIYLLYSLLATSIKEGIATLFGLRARMLQKGIAKGMFSNSVVRTEFNLSNSLSETYKSFNVKKTFQDFLHFIVGIKILKENTLGDHFYNHPIIRSYGSNERFSTPSYISPENFSTVLIEVLQVYYDKHEVAIENYIKGKTKKTIDFNKLPTTTKIDYLLDYLSQVDQTGWKSHFIDRDTLQIIQLYLAKSYQNLDTFKTLLESWFNETMYRATGWYKRQAQFILFLIGFGMALVFNVNIIAIAGKLSTDKDARDKLVSMAIKEADALKNDTRIIAKEKYVEGLQAYKTELEQTLKDTLKDKSGVKELQQVNAEIAKDTTSIAALKKEYVQKRDKIQKMLNGDILDANNLLAIGWGDYGLRKNQSQNIKRYNSCYNSILARLLKNDGRAYAEDKEAYQNCTSDTTITKEYLQTLKDTMLKDSLAYFNKDKRAERAYLNLYKEKEYCIKATYFASQLFTLRNFIGYLLFAIGVCLGAPFWFDLLQKLVKLRAAGKKVDESNSTITANQPPVQVTVNTTNSQTPVG